MMTWALFFTCGSFIVGLLRLFLAVLEFVMKLQKKEVTAPSANCSGYYI